MTLALFLTRNSDESRTESAEYTSQGSPSAPASASPMRSQSHASSDGSKSARNIAQLNAQTYDLQHILANEWIELKV